MPESAKDTFSVVAVFRFRAAKIAWDKSQQWEELTKQLNFKPQAHLQIWKQFLQELAATLNVFDSQQGEQ